MTADDNADRQDDTVADHTVVAHMAMGADRNSIQESSRPVDARVDARMVTKKAIVPDPNSETVPSHANSRIRADYNVVLDHIPVT